jgi:hypothetical protein
VCCGSVCAASGAVLAVAGFASSTATDVSADSTAAGSAGSTAGSTACCAETWLSVSVFVGSGAACVWVSAGVVVCVLSTFGVVSSLLKFIKLPAHGPCVCDARSLRRPFPHVEMCVSGCVGVVPARETSSERSSADGAAPGGGLLRAAMSDVLSVHTV